MDNLKFKARGFGATEFGLSQNKLKRFYVIYKGLRINFGSKDGQTFIDHSDEKKKLAWRARHSKITMKDGTLAYTVKTSAEWWAWHMLW